MLIRHHENNEALAATKLRYRRWTRHGSISCAEVGEGYWTVELVQVSRFDGRSGTMSASGT